MADIKQPEKKVFVRDRDIFNQKKLIESIKKQIRVSESSDDDDEMELDLRRSLENELEDAKIQLNKMIKENKKFNALFAK